MDQGRENEAIRFPLLLKLAVGPMLLLIAGWRTLFDMPDKEALRYCVRPFWSLTDGPLALLVCLSGVVLTYKGVRSAWRSRAEQQADSS